MFYIEPQMTLSCSLWETFPTDVMFKLPPTVQFATWIILKKTHFLTVPLQVIHNKETLNCATCELF